MGRPGGWHGRVCRASVGAAQAASPYLGELELAHHFLRRDALDARRLFEARERRLALGEHVVAAAKLLSSDRVRLVMRRAGLPPALANVPRAGGGVPLATARLGGATHAIDEAFR